MKHRTSGIFISLFILFMLSSVCFSQIKTAMPLYSLKQKTESKLLKSSFWQDTTKPKVKTKTFSLAGFFLSVGGGLSVPVAGFNRNSNVAFGPLGRIEFSSTGIFPLIIGGEINYFSYTGDDQFKTLNVLTTYRTKILSYGLSLEYTFSKILNSSYTIPFVCIDVKNNMVKREYDNAAELEDLPREENKISIGAGFGFTLFVFDFYVKYNYMKSLSNVGVYTKVKIPVLKF